MAKNQDQAPLWTEDILKAMDDVVRACGSYDQVAGVLWPTVKTGYNKLKNKLNPDHHERFNEDEIIHLLTLGREIGCHTAIYHICDEVGYERPKLAAPKSRRTEILERESTLLNELARLGRERDRIDAAQALKAIE